MKFLIRFLLTLTMIGGLTLLEASLRSSPAYPQQRPQRSISSASERLEAVRQRRDALYAEINTLNKDKKCESESQCEVLEAGARLCGGPSSFVAVSTANAKYSAVKTKVAETAAVEKELNSLDAPGDCTAVPKNDQAHCVNTECVLTAR